VSGEASKVAQLRAQEAQRRLSREELLSVHRIEKEIEIPELGGVVVLQSLTHRERARIREESHVNTPEYDEDLLTLLSIVAACVSPKLEAADVEKLRDQDSAIIDVLSIEIGLMNMAGRGNQLGKDSKETTNSGSLSDSANDSE